MKINTRRLCDNNPDTVIRVGRLHVLYGRLYVLYGRLHVLYGRLYVLYGRLYAFLACVLSPLHQRSISVAYKNIRIKSKHKFFPEI